MEVRDYSKRGSLKLSRFLLMSIRQRPLQVDVALAFPPEAREKGPSKSRRAVCAKTIIAQQWPKVYNLIMDGPRPHLSSSLLQGGYHYPPDLFQLLVDTIPRLCRSKMDVLLFFRGAGVRESILRDLRQRLAEDASSINKFYMVRTLLARLNEAGDAALGERRALLQRVHDFEEFSTCWENDRLEAQGLVGQIRQLVNIKDSFTRMRQEREEEARKHREATRREAEVLRQRAGTLDGIRQTWPNYSRWRTLTEGV